MLGKAGPVDAGIGGEHRPQTVQAVDRRLKPLRYRVSKTTGETVNGFIKFRVDSRFEPDLYGISCG